MSIFDIWNQVKSHSTNYEPEVDVGIPRGRPRKIVGIVGAQPRFEPNTSRIEVWVIGVSVRLLLLMKTTVTFSALCP